jgi:ABC-2 type transport system ATP-binding protein
MQLAIEARGLEKTYAGPIEAVKGVDLEVAPGEVFGLLGPNGAGKSTTVGMLTTTIMPTGGSAKLAGFDVTVEPLAARAVSSVVFQETVVDAALTGRQNLELHARLWAVGRRNAAKQMDELTEALGLGALVGRTVATYSGGERRRLEIARALVSRPRVLFLDEPTVGLDPRIRAELLDVIAGLRNRSQLTVLLTTHYLDEAERLCDRLAIMHAGRIVALDTPRALLALLGRELVELQVDGPVEPALVALRERGVAGSDAFAIGSRLTVPLHDRSSHDTIATVHELGLATVISAREPTLDDVYLRLTGDSLAAAA